MHSRKPSTKHLILNMEEEDDLLQENENVCLLQGSEIQCSTSRLEQRQDAIIRELEYEIKELRAINEGVRDQVRTRDHEIARLQIEKQQMLEEKQLLKDQITLISNKAKESMNFAANMAMVSESLQAKLAERTQKEQLTFQEFDKLINQYQKATEYIVDARIQVESLNIQVKSLENQLTEEQDKNLILTIEINRLIADRNNNKKKDEEIESFKREVTSLNVELSLAKHQCNNLKSKTQDQEDRMKQQQMYYTNLLEHHEITNLQQQNQVQQLQQQQQQHQQQQDTQSSRNPNNLSRNIMLSGNLVTESFGSTTFHDEIFV
ncbi:UNKNOWN [Stylonychia lemnae]|uniref:Uncharacterized protein n=1 Tax=Stylonychia lemnae TaxID=5949 RepID=A0A078BCF9_STYLE|nr:UNKNOWN [Stylonychia lemnae]|eukprot:CDW91871.1 UNKNOWN [Stylonychia lemnae]